MYKVTVIQTVDVENYHKLWKRTKDMKNWCREVCGKNPRNSPKVWMIHDGYGWDGCLWVDNIDNEYYQWTAYFKDEAMMTMFKIRWS